MRAAEAGASGDASDVGSYVMMGKLPVITDPGPTEKAPVPNPIFEKQGVAKSPQSSPRSGPRSASKRSPEVAGMDLVSATVYLSRDKLELIKKICGDSNRRISDLISEAVDDYLGRRR